MVKWTRDFGVQAPQNRLRLMVDWSAVIQMWRCASMDINTGDNFMLLLLYDCLTLYWSWLIATQQREYQQFLPLLDISSGFSFHFLFTSLCRILKFKKKNPLKSETDTLIIYLWGQNKGVLEYSWEEVTIFRLVCYWAKGEAGVGRGGILGLNGRMACECSFNSNTQTKQATLWTFHLHQVYS